MAHLHESKNDLIKQIAHNRRLIIFFIWPAFFLTLIAIKLAIFGPFQLNNGYESGLLVFILILFTLSALKTGRLMEHNNILKSGIEGEERGAKKICDISDEYHVITGKAVRFENKNSYTDAIVVGPKGIFIVEIKNHNGTIKGNTQDKHLFQLKVGRGGSTYSSNLYNPSKQVGTHVWRLSKLLKENDVHNWVQGVAYFVNPNVSIDLSGNTRHICGPNKSFSQYLNSYNPNKLLTESEINKIVQLILHF